MSKKNDTKIETKEEVSIEIVTAEEVTDSSKETNVEVVNDKVVESTENADNVTEEDSATKAEAVDNNDFKDKTAVSPNDVVYVRVIKPFNDATNNNSLMKVNSCYRTTRSRADMLVNKGFVEYYPDQIIETAAKESIVDKTINNTKNPNV